MTTYIGAFLTRWPLPMGEVPPGGGRRGLFYPLSHFVTAPPKWEPREGTKKTDCDRWESLERVTPECSTGSQWQGSFGTSSKFKSVPKGHRFYSLFTVHSSPEKGRSAEAPRPLRKFRYTSLLLLAISARHLARKASAVMAPRSSPLRVRTDTVPFSISRSPTTSI